MALHGRALLRKPRLYQSCSAEEEEEEIEEEKIKRRSFILTRKTRTMLQTYKTILLPVRQNIRLSKYRGRRGRCVPSSDTT
jgi:hypothetical protein